MNDTKGWRRAIVALLLALTVIGCGPREAILCDRGGLPGPMMEGPDPTDC